MGTDSGPLGPRDARRDEAGSTLVLMPIAVLILLGLAAMAVDAAVVHLGQLRLSDLAAGLARDAVAAIDEQAFYEQGRIEVVGERVLTRRDARLAALAQDPGFTEVRCDEITVVGDQATVGCTATVRPIFGVVLPGGRAPTQVRAVETARATPG